MWLWGKKQLRFERECIKSILGDIDIDEHNERNKIVVKHWNGVLLL